MQCCATNTKRQPLGKLRFNGMISVQKANTLKWDAIPSTQLNAQLVQGSQGIHHQSFAASLVERRMACLHYGHVQSLVASHQSRRQPGGSPSDNDYIVVLHR